MSVVAMLARLVLHKRRPAKRTILVNAAVPDGKAAEKLRLPVVLVGWISTPSPGQVGRPQSCCPTLLRACALESIPRSRFQIVTVVVGASHLSLECPCHQK